MLDLHDYVASIPNFPEEGITFRDITPLLADGAAYAEATHQITEFAQARGVNVIVGPESRGFLVGAPVAHEMGIGLVPPVANKSSVISTLSPGLMASLCNSKAASPYSSL